MMEEQKVTIRARRQYALQDHVAFGVTEAVRSTENAMPVLRYDSDLPCLRLTPVSDLVCTRSLSASIVIPRFGD